MPVKVKIPAPLRQLTGGVAVVECEPGTVRELIGQVDQAYPGFAERVTEEGALRRFVNVFVAGEDVRFAQGIETAVADGQDLTILPAVAGGSY
jgi:sulfur-carrier protein